jgi:SAM-dependent methyltransferase
MPILNAQLRADLDAGRPVRLNLGSGGTLKQGFYGVDHLALPGVDVQADLNQPLDWLPDASVEEIYSRHAFEHIREILPLMRELHRVLKPGGTLHVIVPHFSNPYYYSDLTHCHPFGLYTFFYFCDRADQPRRKVPSFYVDFRYRVERLRIRFYRHTLFDKLLAPVVSSIVNIGIGTQTWYERRLCWLFHAWEIECVMHPVKS